MPSDHDCLQQAEIAVTLLMAAVAQSQSGKNKAFIRAVAKACLQAGLSRTGMTYTLQLVRCQVLAELIEAQGVTFTGKLIAHLRELTTSLSVKTFLKTREEMQFSRFASSDH